MTHYRLKTGPFSSHTRLMEAFPAVGSGASVIDIGGGEGYLGRLLSQRGFRVTCVAEPGSVTADAPAGIEFREADLNRELPTFDTPFDYALCGDVLEHLVDPAAVLVWIRESLTPSGTLVASLPNSGHFFVRLNVLLGRFPEDDKGLFDRTHLHFYAWRNWKALLERTGFSITQVQPTVIPFGLAWPRLDDGLCVRALETTNYWLASVQKTFWAYQFVVVAQARRV